MLSIYAFNLPVLFVASLTLMDPPGRHIETLLRGQETDH
jgi:hypothetical protein